MLEELLHKVNRRILDGVLGVADFWRCPKVPKALQESFDIPCNLLKKASGLPDFCTTNTCFIIIVTTLQACKLSKIAFNIQTKTSKVA